MTFHKNQINSIKICPSCAFPASHHQNCNRWFCGSPRSQSMARSYDPLCWNHRFHRTNHGSSGVSPVKKNLTHLKISLFTDKFQFASHCFGNFCIFSTTKPGIHIKINNEIWYNSISLVLLCRMIPKFHDISIYN